MPCVRRCAGCFVRFSLLFTGVNLVTNSMFLNFRALVDSIIKERSERSMHRDDENTSRQAATHMLVYGLVGVGAQVSK
jgi:hypothetical protein